MRKLTSDMDIIFTKVYTPSFVYKSLPFGLESVSRYFAYEHYSAEREFIDNYLILYTIDGAGTLEYEGNKYYVGKNQMFFIDCNKYHIYKPTEGGTWDFYYTIIFGSGIKAYYDLMFGEKFYIIDNFNIGGVKKFVDNILYYDSCLTQQFEIMAAQQISSFLTNILMQNNGNNSELMEAVEYIEENFAKKISVDDMADIVHMSKFHFIRKFKSLYIETPYEYTTRYRVNQAKMLLTTTTSTIDEISIATGFNDTNTFIRAFKKFAGITPSKYRKYDTN